MTDLVPTIDLTPFRLGGAAERLAVARQVGRACEEIGFLLVGGHGVPDPVIDGTYATAKAFFDLPVEDKAAIRRPSPTIGRGWVGMAHQALAASIGKATPPDLQENITFGPPAGGTGPYWEEGWGASHFAANLWPDRPPGFAATVTAYYRAMDGLAATLMQAFALALDLPEDHFAPFIDRHISAMRFINYPDQPDAPAEGQLRAGAHSDYGSLTIVRVEDAPGGLQVRDAAGAWRDVAYRPGALVVNIGDLMAQWTNDRWVSTLHRVVNPPRDRALGSRRISLVFFHQPNYDAEIAALPSCVSADRPAKYAPISSGAHWRAKSSAAQGRKPLE